jgi:hypothetical protein
MGGSDAAVHAGAMATGDSNRHGRQNKKRGFETSLFVLDIVLAIY